ARGCGAHHDTARAEAALLVVVKRAALAQRDADHVALGLIGGLPDRLRHFAGFPGTVSDLALLVADDDDRREAEALAALDHLGHAVDADELFLELAVLPVALIACSVSRHEVFPCFDLLE